MSDLKSSETQGIKQLSKVAKAWARWMAKLGNSDNPTLESVTYPNAMLSLYWIKIFDIFF